MKAPLFMGAALLGLALSRPAQAQVVNGTPIAPGTVAPGQPGSPITTPGVGAGTTPLGTVNGTTTAPVVGGTLPTTQPLNNTTTAPRNARRSTRKTTTPGAPLK